jgi:hypothetical protein
VFHIPIWGGGRPSEFRRGSPLSYSRESGNLRFHRLGTTNGDPRFRGDDVALCSTVIEIGTADQF